MPDHRTDWPALNARYGKGRGAAVVARAIKGEMPGGVGILAAQQIVNAQPKWIDPEAMADAADLLGAAWQELDEDEIGYAPAVGCCWRMAVLLISVAGLDEAAESFEHFRWLLGHTRDWVAEELLSRYRVEE